MPMVNIDVSPKIEKLVKNLAKKIDRDEEALLKDLLIRGLEEFYEDLEDIKAIKQYIADGGRNQKMYSMEEVLREFELEELELGAERASSKATTKNAKVSSARNPSRTKPNS
jgi:pyruvate-formate lyase-activating enzyme